MLEGHPLRRLFADLTRETFYHELHHYDSEVAAYLVDLLVGFTHVENLYKIRDAAGRRLGDGGEMLIEPNPLVGAASLHREREVRKHVGDYPPLFTGPFRSHLKRPRRSP